LRLLVCALAGYAAAAYVMSRLRLARAEDYAFVIVIVALAAHWLWFDQMLHAENRYYLRTMLIVATPMLGLVASLGVLRTNEPDGALRRSLALVSAAMPVRALARVLLILALIHAIETAKFTTAWAGYREAVRTLAASSASDPRLGDARFISAERLAAEEARLGWGSTIPFLSVLVTPGFAPARLVVAPDVNFFWLSCETATASAETAAALAAETRDMLRVYSCLHRRN